jgi:hypothetical protein
MSDNADATQTEEFATVVLDEFRAAMAELVTPGQDVLVHASLGGLGGDAPGGDTSHDDRYRSFAQTGRF